MYKMFALDYIVLKLAKWQVESENTNLDIFNENNNFSRKKLALIPFILVTTNGKPNRELIIDNGFNEFYVSKDDCVFDRIIQEYLENDNYESEYINYRNNQSVLIKKNNISIDIQLQEIESTLANAPDKGNYSEKALIKGIDHAIDNVLKIQSYNLYEYSFDVLAEDVEKSDTIDYKINTKDASKIEREDILEIVSVTADDIYMRLFI